MIDDSAGAEPGGARPANEPGQRRPTMNDVARQAGVSRALVSVVFRDAPGASQETRRRVVEAANEIGYRRDDSARALRTTRSYLLGVVFDSRDDFHADLLDACYRAAEPHGYELLLSAVTTSRNQDRGLGMKDMRRRFCDVGWRLAHNGVVFTGASSVTVIRYRYRGSKIPTPWTIDPAAVTVTG